MKKIVTQFGTVVLIMLMMMSAGRAIADPMLKSSDGIWPFMVCTGGTVAGDQTICAGQNPAAFTETDPATGEGTLTYQWQSSTTSCSAGFNNISGETATTYDPPALSV